MKNRQRNFVAVFLTVMVIAIVALLWSCQAQEKRVAWVPAHLLTIALPEFPEDTDSAEPEGTAEEPKGEERLAQKPASPEKGLKPVTYTGTKLQEKNRRTGSSQKLVASTESKPTQKVPSKGDTKPNITKPNPKPEKPDSKPEKPDPKPEEPDPKPEQPEQPDPPAKQQVKETDVTVVAPTNLVVNGRAKEVSVTIAEGVTASVSVSYTGNTTGGKAINVGSYEAHVTANGTGDYTGTVKKSVSFTIKGEAKPGDPDYGNPDEGSDEGPDEGEQGNPGDEQNPGGTEGDKDPDGENPDGDKNPGVPDSTNPDGDKNPGDDKNPGLRKVSSDVNAVAEETATAKKEAEEEAAAKKKAEEEAAAKKKAEEEAVAKKKAEEEAAAKKKAAEEAVAKKKAAEEAVAKKKAAEEAAAKKKAAEEVAAKEAVTEQKKTDDAE